MTQRVWQLGRWSLSGKCPWIAYNYDTSPACWPLGPKESVASWRNLSWQHIAPSARESKSSSLGGRSLGGVATGLAVGAGIIAAEAIGRNLTLDYRPVLARQSLRCNLDLRIKLLIRIDDDIRMTQEK